MSATAIPRPALILGWLGVAPFALFALAGGLQIQGHRALAIQGLVAYGAVILSFMGGVQWGLAMAAPTVGLRRAGAFAVSVLPALAAWSCVLLPGSVALAGLAGAFALWLTYDLWTVRQGDTPAWYASLRAPLTLAVVACLLTPVLLLRA